MPMTASNIGGRGEPLRSASAIVASTESGQHLLRIDGYSGTKGVPTGSHVKSRSFRVGGHSWHICYYPNGCTSTCSDSISIFLKLDHDVPQGVRARFTFSLLDHGDNKPVPHYTFSDEHTFRDDDRGFRRFIRRDELEKSEHLKHDRFTIRCDLTVGTGEIQTMDIDITVPQPPPPPVVDAAVVVPPSDLHRHLGGLLATGEAADVRFEVDTRTFAAHRCVLMARSPVFHAELSSSSLTTTTTTTNDGAAVTVVRIEDMEAQDFEAFLHYMYTDSLPPEMMKKESEAAATMLPDLVAAANRYKMERLRLVCEDKLSKLVNVTTVAAILAFAVEHHCLGLKEVCLKFLEDPANLREVVKTDGLEHLSKSCPSVLKDMITKLAGCSPAVFRS